MSSTPYLSYIKSYPLRFTFFVVLFLIMLQYIVNVVVYKRQFFAGFIDGQVLIRGKNYKWNLVTDAPRSLSTVTIKSRHPKNVTLGHHTTTMVFINSTEDDESDVRTTSKPPELVLKSCNNIPPGLQGTGHKVIFNARSWNALEKSYPAVRGGQWQPYSCVSQHHVAVIIPYRNRDHHLRVLMDNLHPLLQRQEAYYVIIVVDQLPGSRFNRAALFNIGFKEALKVSPKFSCFIFHDVDLLPEDDRNLYRCGAHPRHMSAAIDKFNYRLPYAGIFGGVSALSKSQFTKVNGFSNLFFGWGGEDDDMANRVKWNGYDIKRYPMSIARYKMIKHGTEPGNGVNPLRFRLIKEGRTRMYKDGLSNLRYKRMNIVARRRLVYWVQVTIPEQEVLHQFGLA